MKKICNTVKQIFIFPHFFQIMDLPKDLPQYSLNTQTNISTVIQALDLNQFYLPYYLEKLLEYNGFDSIYSLANFNLEEDSTELERYARNELRIFIEDIPDEEEKKNNDDKNVWHIH